MTSRRLKGLETKPKLSNLAHDAFQDDNIPRKTNTVNPTRGNLLRIHDLPTTRLERWLQEFDFFNYTYYISKLVRALWLVNLARRTLLHGSLKFDFFCCRCVISYQIFLNYIESKSLEISFTTNCVRTKACSRLKNDFKLTRFAFDLLQKFEVGPHE